MPAQLIWRPAGSPWDTDALSPEEAAHVAALRPGPARDAQALSYALRREVLGDVTIRRHCAACGSTEHGRPFVPGGPSFSVSRAAGGAAIAVAADPIGLDVAAAQPDATWAELAPRMWAPEDAPLDPQQAWTAKEAVLKLLGHGLAVPMGEVRVAADGAWTALGAAGHVEWRPLGAGVLAALATPSAGTSARPPRP